MPERPLDLQALGSITSFNNVAGMQRNATSFPVYEAVACWLMMVPALAQGIASSSKLLTDHRFFHNGHHWVSLSVIKACTTTSMLYCDTGHTLSLPQANYL
jgi:hypothetical protein